MSDILFEITEDKLETGMRGYPVGYCTTSSADPEKGLSYKGRPIIELAELDPEEVIALLYGDPAVKTELQKRVGCDPKTLEAIRKLPRDGHPMKLFSAALLISGMIEGEKNYQEDCLNLIARVPEIAATVITHHGGWQMNPSDSSLGYMENFTHMINIPEAHSELTHVMRLFNILHYDHGGGNLSAFIGKGVASGLEDLHGSLAAAMCALAGPRHGRANQDCLEFVRHIHEMLGDDATESQVEELIRERLANHQLIYGFGHAVLRVEDPRATLFYQVSSKLFPDHPLVKIAHLLRKAGTKVLKESSKVADPYPNVDAMSGTLLTAAGFGYPEYYTVLFGLARVVGIGIQIVYERCEAREGKGTPIIRPKYYYRESS